MSKTSDLQVGNPPAAIASKIRSAMKFYAPKLVFVIGSIYSTPYAAIKEAIQNAIDAGGKRVEVVIDLYGNHKLQDRKVIVRDNGKGLSPAEFTEKMAKIGDSDKTNDSDSLGRHGLGLLSFLGKAREYTFTSCSKANKGKSNWKGYFRHDLANRTESGSELHVEGDPVPELNKAPAWWNTEVKVRDFEVKRLQVSLDMLEEDIRSDFNLAMLKYGTQVEITYIDARGKTTSRILGARHYTGQRFKHHVYNGQNCGRVIYEMYRLKDQTGTVTIKTERDSYTKNWNKMREQAIAQGMDKDLADALGSGYFEGVISVENCEWSFDRSGFKPSDEIAWLELVVSINEWMETEDVQRHLNEMIGRKEEEQEFAFLKKLCDYFSSMFHRDPGLLYEPLVNLPAAVSAGHVPVEGAVSGYTGRSKVPGKIVRTEEEKTPQRKRGGNGETKERNKRHFSVETERGNSRYVSKTQIGLSFGIRSIGTYDYYIWDLENGILVINRDHPYYQAIKESEEKVWEYFFGIARWAICRLMADDASNEVVESNLRQVERQYMIFLTDQISQMKTSPKARV